MDKKTVSNKTVIVVAIICVVLFGLMMVGAFMMTGGSNSGDLENYNAEFSDGVKLTWDELMKEENGEKYGYKADRISKEEIGIDAFKGSELVQIKIPETVTKIGKNAFESIKVESLTIPVTVQSIGKNAFANIEKMHIEYHGTMKEWCKVIGVLNLGDLNNEIEVETAPNEN